MNTAFALLAESGNVIERIQALGTADKQLTDPDYWSSVGIITLTGILVVFLILAILIFFFWLMGTIFKSVATAKANKKAAEAEAAKAAVPAPAPVVEEAAVEEEEITDDDEIIAVISAAIAAYEGEGYTIKSISRRGSDGNGRTRSAWSMAGLSCNMTKF